LTTVRPAWAFDQAAYLERLDAIRAELVKKTLADSKATLARLDELVTIGTVALREYGAKNPKYAKLMEAVIANAPEMKTYSDAQLEDIWGEKGNGGDAVGITQVHWRIRRSPQCHGIDRWPVGRIYSRQEVANGAAGEMARTGQRRAPRNCRASEPTEVRRCVCSLRCIGQMLLEHAEVRATARCACARGATHQHAIQGVRRRLYGVLLDAG